MLAERLEKRWLTNQDGRQSDRVFRSHCAVCQDVRVFQRCGDTDVFRDNFSHYHGEEKPKVAAVVEIVEEPKVTVISKPSRPQPHQIYCYDCQDFRFTVGTHCPVCRKGNTQEWIKSDMRREMSESEPKKSPTNAAVDDPNTIITCRCSISSASVTL